MRRLVLWTVAALVSLGLLMDDPASALPMRAPQPDALEAGNSDEVRVARKRRRRRRRKKPKPKPKPKPDPADAPAAAPEPDPGGGAGKGEDAIPLGPGGRSRVDFDAMQIKGQTTKAGEVQILERKDTELKSMVKRRTSFREEIILSVFPEKAGTLK